MKEIVRGSPTETLEYLHGELDAHFRQLSERRQALEVPSPVFAIEHGLGEEDIVFLQDAVRGAYKEGLSYRIRKAWLPFVVHATEVGYIYDGVEYWPIFSDATTGWLDTEYERDRIRDWFRKFADEYGGAIPQGAWAATFKKIAWPITHAVLPRYLQVQLARLLYDYRTGWPSLLEDPAALGVRLHSWSRHYSDRLEKFCQNTALLGHVAVALLLSGEGEDSPYIERVTLDRLVAGLNSERQSRRWLQDARRSASIIKARGFRTPTTSGTCPPTSKRLPAATDPKLQLKREHGVWKAYAILPDLKPLQHSLPLVFDELRSSRVQIAGARQVIPTGGLLFATEPVEFKSWPWPSEPFLQLERGSREVNLLIADQCRITTGAWWAFRRKPGAPAAEVKGKFVRPGELYCFVGATDQTPPDVSWCQKMPIDVEGVCAYDLEVPLILGETDTAALLAAGISLVSDVSIRPVGVVASGWDGEGSVEWLAGEPGLIAIHAEHAPSKCRLTINGDPYYIEWPTGQTEIFLSLDGFAVGTYELVTTLGDTDSGGRRLEGTLIVTISDPQVRPEGASAGEGIRLRTSPAQPSLPEMWDGRAVVEVDGPAGTSANIEITLRDGDGKGLGSLRRSLKLPVSGEDWKRLFGSLRGAPELTKYYDDADLADLSVSRAGIGFASLSCERGFRGLRWVVSSRHRAGYSARLIDRTDGDPVRVDFFSVERPLITVAQPANQEFVGPPRGGLLWATNGDLVAGQIIPPDPNEMMRIGPTEPTISTGQKSLAEVQKLMRHHRQWKDADLPAHPFGQRERQRVLDAITSALVAMLAPGQWASFEQHLRRASVTEVDLNRAQSLVGDSPQQRELAKAIGNNLWQWVSPEALLRGFADAIAGVVASSGISNKINGARFLLQLASSPGELLDWNEAERHKYLGCVFTSPVLVRAARFAVLGTVEEVAGRVG